MDIAETPAPRVWRCGRFELSLEAPRPPQGSFDAARGQRVERRDDVDSGDHLRVRPVALHRLRVVGVVVPADPPTGVHQHHGRVFQVPGKELA